jgi:hypothetical protein
VPSRPLGGGAPERSVAKPAGSRAVRSVIEELPQGAAPLPDEDQCAPIENHDCRWTPPR